MASKGKIIHTGSVHRNQNGVSTFPFPAEVRTASAPKARIVAYFYTEQGQETELVTDSLYVDIGDVCKEEVSMISNI